MSAHGKVSDDATKEWVASIPAEILRELKGVKVSDYGFGAGPNCVAGKTWKGPCSIKKAIRTIVRYRRSLRAAHVRFDDGTCVWFRWDGFHRVDHREQAPAPGVMVRHKAPTKTTP